MDKSAFERDLTADGFTEIETKSFAPGYLSDEHFHGFEVRSMVLEGEITVTTRELGAVTYRPGDVLSLAPGCLHVENIGPKGLTSLIGRRH